MSTIIDVFIKNGMEAILKNYSEDLPHEKFLKATTIPDRSEYVFRWDEVPGKEKKALMQFLSQNLDIDWPKNANIEKIDIGNTIKIYKEIDTILLKLNENKTKVILEIYDTRENQFVEKMKFVAITESGELNIYKPGKKTSEHVRSVVEKLYYLLNNKINEVIEFKDPDRCESLRKKIELGISDPEKRMLLCAALYHDIGKSIIFPRHGPEGADVIKDSGQKERNQFRDLDFDRYDFYFISDLIRFHDYLGMLGTGEVSYLIMAETLNPISNISLSNSDYSEKFFDFLFLLNIADIAGTIGKVDNEDYTIMVHDFKIIKKIYTDIINRNKSFNYIENQEIMSELLALSENHTHERLRRLLRNGFKKLYRNKELKTYIMYLNSYVFSWGNVPGKDSEKLKKFISNEFDLEWAKTAEITRTDGTIELYTKKESLSLILDAKKTEVKIYIDDPRKNKLIVKEEDQELRVYKDDHIQFSSWFSRDDQRKINDIIPLISSLRAINLKPDFNTKFAYICKLDYFLGFLRDLFTELILIESRKREDIKGSHDLRRDFSMTLMELIDALVEQYGDFTSNSTKIGLGFERYQELKDMKCHNKMLTRLTGANGEFKESEAFNKLRNMAVLWVIRP